MKPSDRQAEVLALVAEGLTNIEIGKRLFIGATTVHTHLSALLLRAKARNRTHLVTIAFREGWLK